MIVSYLLSPWTGSLVGAAGVWLILTQGARWLRATGGAVAVAGLLILSAGAPLLGDMPMQLVFWMLAGLTAFSAVATVASRSPVYSAIWFALMLSAVAGLLVAQGAQFLGVATLVVYAGAIVVMFLFVLMLAQPEGEAYYDRVSWGRLPVALAALTAAIIVAGVMELTQNVATAPVADESPAALAEGVLHSQHTAQLGGQLFSRHLIAVEVAGTLLLAALVGAIAIIIAGKPRRPDTQP